ncbi:bifunctional nuclease family protein [Corynebacterium sanguinis]|uniref:bifunctional nuclease family protein n=1 Tax=Corynebacterium sanguinis TaxID=2594913 RepID=UPI0021A92F5F|nr:bifunctional nuclease family protein [Corynebacterium sanguinis]MCT1444688.1 bifunctional nuclease family protein [Corynebacterium sanguinis]
MAIAQLAGIYPLGPEKYLCAVLLVEGTSRCLPVWLPPVEGARLIARAAGWHPNRPHATDALVELAQAMAVGPESVEIASYHEGVFACALNFGDGTSAEMRPCDALTVALKLDLALEVDESVISAASLWLSPEDAAQYFELELDDERLDDDAPQPQGDDEFEELMRNLGVDENDLGGGDGTEEP